MKVWSLNELFRLTRAELLDLQRRIGAELAPLPENHTDRGIGGANLRNIRIALARPEYRPS